MAEPMTSIRRIVLLFLLGAFCAGPMRAARDESWIEIRTSHFTVVSNAGEKQARRIADQFEQIRAMFHTGFPSLRVDPGQPILILAAKNENSLKALLPAYWEQKGHVHPAGLFLSGQEKHYVALRLDVNSENPYHSLYHEYTHALIHLNWRRLPSWLDEGLADFYGNTVLGEKEIQIGQIDAGSLILLQQSKLIPIDVLLQVDHTLPYYNEENRASVFYAESWALVHYFFLDPEARQKQLLDHFLRAWQASGNQVAAAQQAFGDLKQFARKIEAYVRQERFYFAKTRAPAQLQDKDYVFRPLSLAESLAVRGDFHLHMERSTDARELLEQAAKLDPRLPAVHESLGYLHYRQHNLEAAAAEFSEAVKLDSRSFLAHYFHAFLALQQPRFHPEAFQDVPASLERAIQLNPNFAPAYAALSSLYFVRPETREKALDAARRAAQLEPGSIPYAFNLAQVLASLNGADEARKLGSEILAAATSPEERAMVQALLQRLDQQQQYFVQEQRAQAERAADREALQQALQRSPQAEDDEKDAKEDAQPRTGEKAPSPAPSSPRVYSMMGLISEANCANPPQLVVTLTMGPITMKLHAEAPAKIEFRGPSPGSAAAIPCSRMHGKTAHIFYHLTPGKDYDGEITAIEWDRRP